MPVPAAGPHVVERVPLWLDTWRRIEAEAAARAVSPRDLLVQIIEVVMSPELQQALTPLTRPTPPAA